MVWHGQRGACPLFQFVRLAPLFKPPLQPGALLDHIIELIDDYSPGDGLVFKKTLIPLYWSFRRTDTSRTVIQSSLSKGSRRLSINGRLEQETPGSLGRVATQPESRFSVLKALRPIC